MGLLMLVLARPVIAAVIVLFIAWSLCQLALVMRAQHRGDRARSFDRPL